MTDETPVLVKTIGLCVVLGMQSGCVQSGDFDAVSKGPAQGTDSGPKPSDGSNGGDSLTDSQKGCAAFLNATVCHDFTAELGAQGFEVKQTNGAVARDQAIFLSPPASFSATSNGKDQNTRALIAKEFAQFANQPIKLKVDFHVRVAQFDSQSSRRITVFSLIQGAHDQMGYSQLAFQLISNIDTVTGRFVEWVPDIGGYEPHPVDASIKLREWAHVQLEIKLLSPAGKDNNWVRVLVDGESHVDQAIRLGMKGQTPRTEFGITDVELEAKPVLTWNIQLDDYAITIEKL